MADGARGVLRDDVPAFASKHPALKSALAAAGSRALNALDEFRAFLKDRLPLKAAATMRWARTHMIAC